MAKFLIQIEDQGDEVTVQCAIDPPLTEDKAVFSTAELVGLYLREHMADLLKAAVAWSKEPEPAPAEQPALQAPKLILPDDINGVPV
jgi:hypothetical protein